MKKEQDYIRDLAEIRLMMERSSKFLSLSGWEGILAGVYALAGAGIAFYGLGFNPDTAFYNYGAQMPVLLVTAVVVFVLAISTAFIFSQKKARKKGETAWNAVSRRMLASMAVPLLAGALLILMLIAKGLAGLIAPLSLLFYGLALYNASNYTVSEVKVLGCIQIALGLIGVWFVDYGMLVWALGFGMVHIVYGLYMHIRYGR